MRDKQSLNRREFLKRSAALGAVAAFPTIIPASALGADGAVAPSNRIVLGCVGLGWQGTSNMLEFLQKAGAQIVAVCDLDQEHLEKARQTVNKKYGNEDCRTYRDFREMYGRGDLDAVSLGLPDHWHAIPAIAAARAGLDIYGEKPFSHSLREGRAMVEAVARHGRIWQTGSWQRSRENFHRACELVRNGRIGKVYRVEVGLGGGYKDYADTGDQQKPGPAPKILDYETWLGPAPWAPYCAARVHKNWRWVMDTGGGRIMDWVGHHLDIGHWGLGLDTSGPILVEGWGKYETQGVWDAPTDYEVNCTYEGGLMIVIGSRVRGGTKWIGNEGWVHVDRGSLKAEPESVLKETIGPNEIRLYRSLDHWQNFLDCIRSRRPTITPAEVAHRSASVGHLCLIAIKTGRAIRWDPATERILGDPDASRLLGNAYREPWQL